MARLDAALEALERCVLGVRWALAGALVAYFSFVGGGYFPGSVGLAAVLLLAVVALFAIASVRTLPGWGVGVALAAVPLAGLGMWAYASSGWSGSVGRASIEADRVLLYLAVLLATSAFGWSAARMRGLLLGLLAAAVAVSAIGLAAQLFPTLLSVDHGPNPDRLTYPVSYWNAAGLLAGMGTILAVHAASSLEERLWIRCLAAAAVPLLACTVLLSVSRGAVWCSALGLAVYLVVGRPRGLPAAALAIGPATLVALLGFQHGAVVQVSPDVIESYGLGAQPAWILGGCMVAAALVRLWAAPLDGALARIELRPQTRRAVLASAGALAAVSLLLAVIVARDLGLGNEAYDRFVAGTGTAADGRFGTSRLTDVNNNNRLSKWRIAVDAFRADPMHGSGAGTFELSWERERNSDGIVRDAHSLYVETLGELGLPGLILLVAALVALLGGLLLRARGPARAAPAAMLGAGIAWAASAGFDWDWELPVVTLWIFAAGGLALARRADAPPRLAGRRGVAARGLVVAACLAVAILPTRVALSEAKLQDGVQAAERGDCPTAVASAHGSLSALGSRWEAWQLLGWCAAYKHRYHAAQRAFANAAERDPQNWLPRFSEGVARAATGADPTADLDAAFARNPRERKHTVLASVRQGHKRALRQTARSTPIPLP